MSSIAQRKFFCFEMPDEFTLVFTAKYYVCAEQAISKSLKMERKMKSIKLLLWASVSFLSLSVMAEGKEPAMIPEIEADQHLSKSASGSATMKCLVDTPAWDRWGYGQCFSAGNARTTTAFFQIEGGPSSNYRVYWSDSRCSQSSKSCSLPIRQYQTLTVSADILDLSNNTFSSVSATAHYEGFH